MTVTEKTILTLLKKDIHKKKLRNILNKMIVFALVVFLQSKKPLKV
jgi:hypothetical protein